MAESLPNSEIQNAATQTEGAVAEALPAFDTEEIVEAAEQLLREGAPHDFDLLVIGAGPGGVAAALRAAQQGARVGLIESREIGGVHVNRGGLPLKALLYGASQLREIHRAQEFGLHATASLAFTEFWLRRERVAQEVRNHTKAHLEALGVKILRGRARFVEPHNIEILHGDETVESVAAVNVLIATGAVPSRLQVPGVDLLGVLSTRQIWELENLPSSLAVVGAGALGVEFAQLFQMLGVPVTLIDYSPHVLPLEDPDIARELENTLSNDGMKVLCGAKLQRIEQTGSGLQLVLETDDKIEELEAEKLLVTAGRKPNTEHLQLDVAGITTRHGRILVDDQCQTNVTGVFAVGDCTRGTGWAHQAMAEGALVADIVTGFAPRALPIVPHVYYTSPEVASVGHGERAAQWAGHEINVGICHFHDTARATTKGEYAGFVKIIADATDGKLLGCQIIGPAATELINQAALALHIGLTARQLAEAPCSAPTFGEVLAEAARRAQHSSENDSSSLKI
jgi:dihydrolipoamide dehydrogenase